MHSALAELPTPVAKIVTRALTSTPGRDAYVSWLCVYEVFLKYVFCLMVGLLRQYDKSKAYEIEFSVSRADSIGVWYSALEQLPRELLRHDVPKSAQVLIIWLTQKSKASDPVPGFDAANERIAQLRTRLIQDGDDEATGHIRSISNILSYMVYVRNKTIGHGAKPDTFFHEYHGVLADLLTQLLTNAPLDQLSLSIQKPTSLTESVRLRGPVPTEVYQRPDLIEGDAQSALYVRDSNDDGKAWYLPILLTYEFETDSSWFANSSYNASTTKIEFINYFDGKVRKRSVIYYATNPVLPSQQLENIKPFPSVAPADKSLIVTSPALLQRHNSAAIESIRNSVDRAEWAYFPLLEAHRQRVPEIAGVYCLVSHAECVGLLCHRIIGYVGVTGNLRERFHNYVGGESGASGREHVNKFLTQFPDIHFWYIAVASAQDRTNLETWLVRSVDPPINIKKRGMWATN